MADKPKLTITELLDRLDAIREEILILQRSLEDMERTVMETTYKIPTKAAAQLH